MMNRWANGCLPTEAAAAGLEGSEALAEWVGRGLMAARGVHQSIRACDASGAAAYREHRALHREPGVLKRSAALALAALALSGGVGFALRAASAAAARPAACERQAPVELPVNPWPAAHSELAPPGASAIRLCRYNALGVPRGLAASAVVSDPSAVGRLTRELDSLPSLPRVEACPLDTGALIDLIVAYSDNKHGLLVQVDLTGCAVVANGSVDRTAGSSGAGRALLATIEQLTGYKGPVF
jgi:hypothetical protein